MTTGAAGPEVSRSAGVPNGVVVLWPRIIPSTMAAESRDLAGALQNHLRNLVAQALPGRAIDMRPEPERVCPQGGCQGVSVGILFTRDENGCAAVALVSAPGQVPARLIPWVGVVELRQGEAPFREPPENHVEVKDFTPCGDVLGRLADHNAEIVAAIRTAAG